jgi:hypothetical protein
VSTLADSCSRCPHSLLCLGGAWTLFVSCMACDRPLAVDTANSVVLLLESCDRHAGELLAKVRGPCCWEPPWGATWRVIR